MVLRCSGCSPVHVIFGDFVVTVHSFGFPSLIFFALQYNTIQYNTILMKGVRHRGLK